ncbi:MAG TPA: hypothetical protein VKU83_00020 [Puia sp.]|nr:hypothetical protein [Puia sp.]
MTDPRYYSEDYISLDHIKAFFYSFVKGLFSVVDSASGLIVKYWMLFLVLVVMGTGVGYLLKSVVTYNSQLFMLVKFNDLDPSVYLGMINSVNDQAKSKAYARLATELGLKQEDAQQITEVSLDKPGKETWSPEDSSASRTPFMIKITLRSITAADAVQSAIMAYFNENAYIKSLKEGQLAYYQDELVFINSELRKLDSLKSEYNRSLTAGKNPTIYYNAFNPADIYGRSATLMDRKENLANWFATQEHAASLISGIKQEKVAAKRSFILVVWGFLAGVLLSFWIAIWRELRIRIAADKQDQPGPSAGK